MVMWRRRRGRCGPPGSFRGATFWGWCRIRNWVIALRTNFFGHRLEPKTDSSSAKINMSSTSTVVHP